MKKDSQYKDDMLETRYNFALQARSLRERAGLSVKEMAEKSGIMERHIKQLELGKLENIGSAFNLARFFDKKVEINLV